MMMAVNLDYAATTPIDSRVMAEMMRCMREAPANPSAAYSAAGAARRELRLARQALAGMLGCEAGEIVFTSGGTESNSLALSACAGRHAVVSAVEHASVIESARRWAGQVTLAPVGSDGVVTPEAIEAAMRPDTALVSVQWANNETGVLQPVEAIARVVRGRGALFHVDAVQAFGHVRVDAGLCDLLSLSAHKFYGPRGAGALYVRQGVPLRALLSGGRQEGGLRAGTENVPAIAGMRLACELAGADMACRAREERALLAYFAQLLPEATLLGADAPRLPGVLALRLPRPAEEVIAAMDLRGFELSGGAACAARSHEPSHVYTAMGVRPPENVIRVSIGRGIDKEALTRAAQALRACCSL